MGIVLQLMSSNSTRGTLEQLLALYRRQGGAQVGLRVDTAKATRQALETGAAADAVVLSTPMLQELEDSGRIAAGSRRPFGRAAVGVAVRRGFPRPDIGSVEAFRQALLSVRSIAHTLEGASGRYVPELLQRLGIAEALHGRIVTRPGGPIGPVVVSGEADLALQQLPELHGVEGLEIVGPIPEALQRTFETSSAVLSSSQQPQAARELLDYLSLPEHREVFESHGLTQLSRREPQPARSAPTVPPSSRVAR